MPRKKSEKQLIGYGYTRYSSYAQREESTEQQIAEIERFAAANNIRLLEIFSDEAISGRTDRRPKFQKMMRTVKEDPPDVILAYKSNRIARNMLNALTTENELEKLGVQVLYVKEEFGNNAAGRFALRTMMNVNQFYSENLSEDVQRGMYDNAEACKVNGPIPFGYQKGPDGRYEVDPIKAPILQEVFQRVASGEEYIDIIDSLNKRGIKTRRGHVWTHSSFHNMLINERYLGIYIYGKVRKPGGIPRLIEPELFEVVKRRITTMEDGRKKSNSDYILTGKLRCGYCGAYMVGTSGTSKTKDIHYYYACQKKRLDKKCEKKNVRRDYIEQRIAELTKMYILQDRVIEWIAENTIKYQKRLKSESQLGRLEHQLADTEKRIQNIVAAIEQGIITPSTKDRLKELEEEKSMIESRIAVARVCLRPLEKEKIVFWLESFRDGDVSDKDYQARIIKAFVKEVYITDGRIRIDYYYTKKRSKIVARLDDDSKKEADVMAPESSYKLPCGSPAKKCLRICILRHFF